MRLKAKYDWDIRKAQLLALESTRNPRWYWMSFANDKLGFLGAAIIEAPGPMHAYEKARQLGMHPAGFDFEVAFIEAPVDDIPLQARNRFMSPREIQRQLGSLVNMATGEEVDYQEH